VFVWLSCKARHIKESMQGTKPVWRGSIHVYDTVELGN